MLHQCTGHVTGRSPLYSTAENNRKGDVSAKADGKDAMGGGRLPGLVDHNIK